MYKLNAFSTFDFTDTAVCTQFSVDDPGPVVMSQTIRLPNGTIHDADSGTSGTLSPPSQISASIRIKGTSAANLKTNYDALAGLLGTKATLTRETVTGTTETCSARLMSVPEVGLNSAFGANYIDMTVVFVPLGTWS